MKTEARGTRRTTAGQRSAARISIATIAALSFAIIATLASCSSPTLNQGAAASDYGSVTVALAGTSRTVVPSIADQAGGMSITLTDSRGSVFTSTSVSNTTTFNAIYPGSGTIAVSIFADAARTNEIASGSSTFSVLEGKSVTVSVNPTAKAGTKTGTIGLAVSFPASIGIDGVTASLTDNSATLTVATPDFVSGTATITGASVPSGTHILSITFSRGSATIGKIYESVTVLDGIAANTWIDTTGAAQTIRAITAAELYDSTTGLASLAVAGNDVDITAGTYAYSVTVGALASITFIPTGSLDGQTLSYTWTPAGGTAKSGTVASEALSPALATTGTGTLAVTVTAPDRSSVKTYTVTVTRSWTVTYNFGGKGTLASVVAANGATVDAQPAAPTFDGFVFGGWYADANYMTPWQFGAGGTAITADTTIYAKWTETGIVRIGIDLTPTWAGVTATINAGTVVQGTTAICSGNATGLQTAGVWAWYVDGSIQNGETSATFMLNTTTMSPGDHTVFCTTSDGTTYCASIKITVQSALTVSYSCETQYAGTLPAAQTFASGNAVTLATGAATLSRPGYTFAGWAKSAARAAAGTVDYADGANTGPLTASLALHAVWINAAPAPVVNVVSTPGDLKMKLEWTDPGDGDLDHIAISWTGATTGTVSVGAGIESCVIKSLKGGTDYQFTLTAFDAAGLASTPVQITARPGGSL
jgi:hypothetical protein